MEFSRYVSYNNENPMYETILDRPYIHTHTHTHHIHTHTHTSFPALLVRDSRFQHFYTVCSSQSRQNVTMNVLSIILLRIIRS